MKAKATHVWLSIVILVGWLAAPAAVAQSTPATRFVRVAASERYEAARVHRFALGGGYRDLWEAEIELPLLNLETEGGGLVPTGRFGGLQTAVLGFKGTTVESTRFAARTRIPRLSSTRCSRTPSSRRSCRTRWQRSIPLARSRRA